MFQRSHHLQRVVDLINGLTVELRFHSVDEKTMIPYTIGDSIDDKLFADYDICLTGPALAKFDPETYKSIIFDLLSHTWVYARVSPAQKVAFYDSYG